MKKILLICCAVAIFCSLNIVFADDRPDFLFIESESEEMVILVPAKLKINLDKFRNGDQIEFCFDGHCYNFEVGYIETVIFKLTH